MPNDPLRPLFRRQRLSSRILQGVAVMLGLIALGTLAAAVLLPLHPLALLTLLLLAGALFMLRLVTSMQTRHAKDEAAARHLYEHRPARPATLHARQTSGIDGSIFLIACGESRHVAAVMLPKYDYPRTAVTEIVCYEDPDRDRILIKLGEKFHVALRYTHRTFKAQTARFETLIQGVIWALGLTFAGFAGWIFYMADATQQQIDCAISAQHWTEVPATITRSSIERKVRSTKSGRYVEWINHIAYDYRYGEGVRTATQIACTYYPSRQESYARTLQQQFPVGRQTSAWVDPMQPERAVLLSYPTEPFERRRNGMLIGAGLMIVVGLLTESLLYWLLLKRNRRLLREMEKEVWGV